RNSFRKLGEQRQYEPENWVDTRHERYGYFRLERLTFDRSTAAADPHHGFTDFLNYNVLRHNIWQRWRNDAGEPIPYEQRQVRPIVWYTTPELPAHLVKPSFELVARWNEALMDTVRRLKGEPGAEFPEVRCQDSDPDGYCYCLADAEGQTLNPTCPGRYDPFVAPEGYQDAYGAAAVEPYDCYVEVPDAAEPDLDNPALGDSDFEGWFGAGMVGEECVSLLRINTCNKRSMAENGGSSEGLECEQRGDLRFKFLSYVDQPGTPFLGIATLRGDPESGEIVAGDANIAGPALDASRTNAMHTFDLVSGNVSDREFLSGEDVRGFFDHINDSQPPAPPRVDFSLALTRNRASSQDLGAIDRKMKRLLPRLERLKGAEGRANIYTDRLSALKGTELEEQLLGHVESYIMAAVKRVPDGGNASQVSDAILDRVSPFRLPLSQRIEQQRARDRRLGERSIMLPNEYVDDSVSGFIRRHKDWPRARIEFAVNRLLYSHTQLHELGHCLGLRHNFAASADRHHYYPEFFTIDKGYPLPDSTNYDIDGTRGLSPSERSRFEQDYRRVRSERERAGIDGWMSSSVMDYTASWYERLQPLGRYDAAAVRFGYGNLVDVLSTQDVQGARQGLTYFVGGESCSNDADCPYARDGGRAGELARQNLASGIVQRCVASPRVASQRICSNFDDQLEAIANEGGGAPLPVRHLFCSDDRAGGGGGVGGAPIPWCGRFDEGDSYQEIVRNAAESYERMYLFTNFRRYRRNFSDSFSAVLQRFALMFNIYQDMVYRFTLDPDGYGRSQGRFGFYDQFLASIDAMNFFGRVLAQPRVGSYVFDTREQRYEYRNVDPDLAGRDLGLPVGPGKYFWSAYQRGLSGIHRLEVIGAFIDKFIAMQMLTLRGLNSGYSVDVPFYVNFYDLFPKEMQQIFAGLIRDDPHEYMPRVECPNTDSFPTCSKPRIGFLDFYRGDCSDAATCRPDPTAGVSGTVLNGGGSILLRSLATSLGLAQFPVFFDTSFQNQLFVCVEGQGDCHLPDPNAQQGRDYRRYTSHRFGRTFLAWRVEPRGGDVDPGRSIGFELVQEADDLSFLLDVLAELQRGAQPSTDQQQRIGELGYELPATELDIANEIRRIDRRLQSLESFFNLLIQYERRYGIAGYVQ
ncbi:MAG: hypothetical protein MJD61_13985, partial [Proteobacteria bacterium]|nr:hypothetical protein [Pseudomonadota bacterium]